MGKKILGDVLESCIPQLYWERKSELASEGGGDDG